MDKYQFIRQIGQGNYGDVWLVKCAKTRKKYILKRIDLCQASKREQRAAYLEVKLLSTVKHPNIVTYFDSFYNSNGSLFIVMSYCEYGDLYSVIKKQNKVYFEEKQIVHWFVQICLALKYLHDKNILHRNLKTRNIFLSKNKVIKVGNLGISGVLSKIQDMSSTLIAMPYYISPEIFAGKSYNQMSDIWALGCCIYEMATLKHPYVSQDIQSIIQKIKKGKLPPIPDIYSSELQDIISSMLNQNPEKRPFVTKLLLNDYIRRYILLILQDNSRSPMQGSPVEFDTAMKRSKSSTELNLHEHGAESECVLRKSKSTSRVFKNTSESCDNVFDTETDAPSVISVPDINGNGDGNDNSQHRKIAKLNRSKLFTKRTDYKDFKDTYFLEVGAKYRTKSDSDLKESVRHRNISVASSNSLRNSESYLNSNEQKAKGEISFRILSNLTYSLHNARHKTENFTEKDKYEIKNMCQIRSSEYALPEKFVKATTKRNNKQSKRYGLPHIDFESKAVKTSKSAENLRDLPVIVFQDSLSDSERIRQHIMKNTEGKIDDLLLRSIVINDKITQVF